MLNFKTSLSSFTDHLHSLADQIIVSTTSFVVTVVVGRYAGASQLGIYGAAISVVTALMALQDGLILYPFLIKRAEDNSQPEEQMALVLGSAFSLLVSFVAIFVFAITSLFSAETREVSAVLASFALVAPLSLLKDLCRRLFICKLQVSQALAIDAIAFSLQIPLTGLLAWYEIISAPMACVAIGLSSLVATASVINWDNFKGAFRAIRFKTAAQHSWDVGKWMFFSRALLQIQGYSSMWLLLWIAGASASGVYTACLGIVAIANPFLLGIGNILMPRSIAAWQVGGKSALLNQVRFDSVLIGLIMTAFTVAIFAGGDRILALLYGGQEFQGHLLALVLLSLSATATGLGFPATNALSAIRQPRVIAIGGVGAILTVAAMSILLIPGYGLIGAALASLTGNTLSVIFRWAAFLFLVRRVSGVEGARIVLQDIVGEADARKASLQKIGSGDHSVAYLAELRTSAHAGELSEKLVVKLYRSDVELDLTKVKDQLDALTKLHAAVDNHRAEGWQICVPKPLKICEQPVAIVMTAMVGSQINDWLDLEPSTDEMKEAAKGFSAALERIWQQGAFHGDLGSQNILIETTQKRISFIDPGTLESCVVCGQPGHDARTLDLAHFLYSYAIEEASRTKSLSLKKFHKEYFTLEVLKNALRNTGRSEPTTHLLSDLRAYTSAHIRETLTLSFSIRGIWRFYARYRSAQIAERILLRLKAAPRGRITESLPLERFVNARFLKTELRR